MSEPNNETYTLSTLADFWKLGDADRMERAFKEISLGMVNAMRTLEVIDTAAEVLAKNKGEPKEFVFAKSFKWPESMEWTDDGGKEVGVRFLDNNNECLLGVRQTLGPNFHGKPEEDE